MATARLTRNSPRAGVSKADAAQDPVEEILIAGGNLLVDRRQPRHRRGKGVGARAAVAKEGRRRPGSALFGAGIERRRLPEAARGERAGLPLPVKGTQADQALALRSGDPEVPRQEGAQRWLRRCGCIDEDAQGGKS